MIINTYVCIYNKKYLKNIFQFQKYMWKRNPKLALLHRFNQMRFFQNPSSLLFQVEITLSPLSFEKFPEFTLLTPF